MNVADVMTRGVISLLPDDSLQKAAIREQLAAELDRQAWAPNSSIYVTVTNGVVELRGAIHDERQHAALRIAAENIPGVKQVRDDLI